MAFKLLVDFCNIMYIISLVVFRVIIYAMRKIHFNGTLLYALPISLVTIRIMKGSSK
jgi:hypothetical protein